MKSIILSYIATFFLFFAIPLTGVALSQKSIFDVPVASFKSQIRFNNFKHDDNKQKNKELEQKIAKIKLLKIYDVKNKNVFESDFEEYMIGVLIGEMPASFEIEALKAQAVAARSYILDKIINCKTGIKEHFEADVCTDPNHCKAFLPANEAKDKWGEEWISKYLKKINKAVKETKGEYMTFDGEIVKAFFFSMSSGRTELPEEVWVSQLPYLKSVESPYETELPNFNSRTEINFEEFVEKLKEARENFEIGDDILVKDICHTTGGAVKEIEIGNQKFKGTEIRKIFNLRSSNFDLEKEEDGKIIFNNKGFGHGVGMSQHGANEYAKRGKTYKEILKHYYTGIEIKKM